MRKIYLLSLMVLLSLGSLAHAQERPWLGVQIETSDAGVQVVEVLPESPAETAGLQAEDVILSIDETPVGTAEALIDAVQNYAPEDEVILSVQRGEETLEITVTLGAAPEQIELSAVEAMRPRLGIQVEETAEGIKILDVSPQTDSDLKADDIITAINGQTVATTDDVLNALDAVDGTSVELTLTRDGEEVTVEADLIQMPMFEFGQVRARVGLGVQYQMLDSAFATNAGLAVESGALILDVQPDSAAANAGLMAGDIITSVGEIAVDEEHTLGDVIGDFEAGDTVSLTVLRAGEEVIIEATLTELPFEGMGNFRFDTPMPFGNGRGGFHFDGGRDNHNRGGNGRNEFNFGDGMPFNFGDLEDMLPEDIQSATIVCTDSDGNEVFSFSFQNMGRGGNMPFFNMPDGGLNFDELNCEVLEGEPAPSTDGSDL